MRSGWVQNATPDVDAVSRYPTVMAVSLAFTVIMITVVAVRGYVRKVMVNALGPDDWTIFFSAVRSLLDNKLLRAQAERISDV